MLLTQTKGASNFISVALNGVSMNDSVALTRHQHAREHVDRSCLASAIMTQKSDDLIVLDAQCQLINGSELAKHHRHLLQANWIVIIVLTACLALLALEAHLTVIFIEQSLLNRLFELLSDGTTVTIIFFINSTGTQ